MKYATISSKEFAEGMGTEQIVDRIGNLRAEIEPLKQKLEMYETMLKRKGPGVYHGKKFRANVIVSAYKSISWKQIAESLGATKRMIERFTTSGERTSLRMSAHTKKIN